MFEKEYEIRFYEIDYKKRLKPQVLLNFLQDIAAVHADNLGFGYSFIGPKNIGWFLLKYHLKIDKWPQDLDSIIIKTWPKEISKLSCPRDFEIYSPKGEKLGAVSSLWSLIDLEAKKLLLPSKVLENFPTENKTSFETKFPKIKEAENITLQSTFDIYYDDVDINKHVNNSNYLPWALEPLGADFRDKYNIKEIEIQYKKEIKYGNKILSLIELEPQTMTSIHTLKNKETGDILCAIRIFWQQILAV